jgi:hypothetical protein
VSKAHQRQNVSVRGRGEEKETLRQHGGQELAWREIDLGGRWRMTEFAAGSHRFPSFVADLRLSSSVAYSALLLRVREEELFIVFLHSGVLARPIR